MINPLRLIGLYFKLNKQVEDSNMDIKSFMKSGWKTSEGWLHAFVVVAGLAGQYFGTNPYVQIAGTIAAAISASNYAITRAQVKNAAVAGLAAAVVAGAGSVKADAEKAK